jgi:hypothetical protein
VEGPAVSLFRPANTDLGSLVPEFLMQIASIMVHRHVGKKKPQVPPLRYALSKNISKTGPRNCRSLGCARDDKREGDASMESGCWTEGVFHLLGWAAGP